MAPLVSEVRLGARDLRRFEPYVGREAVQAILETAARFNELLAGRVVWNINSTSIGGGVAEMLQPLLGYTRGAGVDTRWLVIGGSHGFFELTKRVHHALHDSRGDGRALDAAAHRLYQETLRDNAAELLGVIQPGDFVLLHDPQTAGLAPALMAHGARVVWRCHIGSDQPGTEVDRGWAFLRPYLEAVPAFVFSRAAYAPPWAAGERVAVIQPSIDVFSAKNEELTGDQIHSILVETGLIEGPMPERADLSFSRSDGTPGRVERSADIVRLGRAPDFASPLVVQVSRWDPLKDMAGVMDGFAAAAVAGKIPEAAHLILAGPNVHAVADDPEAPALFHDVVDRSKQLPHAIRRRVHLVNLPTADIDENAVVVNALQRHATVVVQKSLREGFGLTATEAMWKGRPVIASAVGGLQDQIEDGKSGLLLKNPGDLESFGDLLGVLLGDADRAREIGEAGRERVKEHYLGVRHLLQYAALFRQVDDVARRARPG